MSGFQGSILFMMVSILAISGLLVFFVARAVRRAESFEASEAADVPA